MCGKANVPHPSCPVSSFGSPLLRQSHFYHFGYRLLSRYLMPAEMCRLSITSSSGGGDGAGTVCVFYLPAPLFFCRLLFNRSSGSLSSSISRSPSISSQTHELFLKKRETDSSVLASIETSVLVSVEFAVSTTPLSCSGNGV